MMLFKTLALACSAIAGIAAEGRLDEEERKLNGYAESKLSQDTLIPLTGTEWHLFYFTNAGSHGFPRFQVTLGPLGSPLVDLTDLYCTGDTFTVYVENGLGPIGISNSTDSPVASCNTYTTDPQSAWNNPGPWAHQTILLPVLGTYNITVVMRASPYSAGAMAIRRVLVPS